MANVLGIDIWEGNPNLDTAVLQAAGVKFIIPRLNDMNGGHHMDANFEQLWAQSSGFIRWPYFVYNPWVSGQDNFYWLLAHMPLGTKAVSVDIEVRKPGLSPTEYTDQVFAFMALARLRWNVNIYTGAWFQPCLSAWPTGDEYWWARYPFAVYPSQVTHITWETLTQKLSELAWAPGKAPGPCRLWQCTADRYILPGCGETCVDINIWNDTLEELAAWAGQSCMPPQDWRRAMTQWARQLGYTGPDPEEP